MIPRSAGLNHLDTHQHSMTDTPSTGMELQLPTRNQFVENGMEDSTATPDFDCSVCTDPCLEGEDVVKLIPCDKCYFHRECILAWFTSNGFNHGTCPNDRQILYQIDREIDASSDRRKCPYICRAASSDD
jgi:hypothetical protein